MTADEMNNIVTSAEEHGKFGDISNEESYSYMICLYIRIYTLSTRQCWGINIEMIYLYPCCVCAIYPVSWACDIPRFVGMIYPVVFA